MSTGPGLEEVAVSDSRSGTGTGMGSGRRGKSGSSRERDSWMGGTRWGFVGAGRMATALARGMVSAGAARGELITAYDPAPGAAEGLLATIGGGGRASSSNREVAERSDVVVLAVKPGVAVSALEEIAGALGSRHLLISIAAGVTLATMEGVLGEGRRVVRAMPNTPALIGAGASGYALGRYAVAEDEARARECLESVGRAWSVPEGLMDAVTGLSGSGPAFVYLAIEALSDGGVRAGLPRGTATALAAQTALGAARMVLETGLHPGELKDQVTSPGGTTIAGVHALERGGLRGALMDAVEAASRRAGELAREAEGKGKGKT